jgi:hypothetical protein
MWEVMENRGIKKSKAGAGIFAVLTPAKGRGSAGSKTLAG